MASLSRSDHLYGQSETATEAASDIKGRDSLSFFHITDHLLGDARELRQTVAAKLEPLSFSD
jgi:hypothetical protein